MLPKMAPVSVDDTLMLALQQRDHGELCVRLSALLEVCAVLNRICQVKVSYTNTFTCQHKNNRHRLLKQLQGQLVYAAANCRRVLQIRSMVSRSSSN